MSIKVLIVPTAGKERKELTVAADMEKAADKIIHLAAEEKVAMGENMEEVEVVVVKKGVKANINLTTTHVPVIFALSQVILL